jgi:threonine aldolase
MRQSGIVAAGGLYALRNNLELLRDDHRNAAVLAEGFAAIPGVRLDPAPETNIVYFDISGTGLTGPEAMRRLLAQGVRASGTGGSRLRFVTHLDISSDDVAAAITATGRALSG